MSRRFLHYVLVTLYKVTEYKISEKKNKIKYML